MSTWRAVGTLPLIFFGAYAVDAWRDHRLADCLWMCHVANVMLAFGMLMHRPTAITLAAVWIVFGIPLWIYDMWHTGQLNPISTISHVGGLLVALYAVAHVRVSANPWFYGILVYLAIQQLCRWVTPAALNVNLAHRIYPGWEQRFGDYGAYWGAITLATAVSIWAIGLLLMYAFPPPQEP